MPRPPEAWLSLLLLVLVALVKTILSKTIFDQLPTPVAYSLLSSVVTWVLVALPLAQKRELLCMRTYDLWRVALVSIAVTLDLGMSNIAIALLPLPLQQAIASAIPAATILLESAVTRRLKPLPTYLAIALLCGGAVMMHFGSGARESLIERQQELLPRRELQAERQPSFGRGELAMGLAICFAAIKYVFAKASLQAWKASYGSLGVLFWIEAFVAIQLLPWAYLNGELDRATSIMGERGAGAMALLCAAAALGGFRFFCELLVLRYWSATTLSAANLLAHALIVVLSTPLSAVLPLGAAPFTPLSLAGTTTTLLASLLYILLKLRGSLEGGISGGKDSAGASGVTQRAAYANVAGAAARQDRPTIDSEGGRPSSPTPYDAASQARATRRAQCVLF